MVSVNKLVFRKKADFLLFLIPVLAAVFLFILSAIQSRQEMQRPHLEIMTGNRVYGVYDLDKDQTIRIGETNTCEIREGAVRMTEAACPDQICVHSAAIDRKGGSIVCLPNHIVLRITEADLSEREVDSIAE